MELEDLGLTPGQLAETRAAGEDLVGAWLEATRAQPRLERPAGFFLAGLRSGVAPAAQVDASERQAIHLAEVRVRNLWHVYPSRSEMLADVFERGGPLYRHDTPELRELMVSYWTTLVRAPVHFPVSDNTGIGTTRS
jgi:hypothetical protein